VHLSLHEQERLMIYLAGEVAEKRLKRRRKSLERRENGEDVPEAAPGCSRTPTSCRAYPR
jgi:urease gamma subunit